RSAAFGSVAASLCLDVVVALIHSLPPAQNADESNSLFLEKLERALEHGDQSGGIGQDRRVSIGPVSHSPVKAGGGGQRRSEAKVPAAARVAATEEVDEVMLLV